MVVYKVLKMYVFDVLMCRCCLFVSVLEDALKRVVAAWGR